MDYVDRLAALRVDNDISQKTIAEVLGCQQSAISKFETRKTKYSIEDLIKLCEYYQISADYVLGLSKDMPDPNERKG
mgnify:CR=1 FL=1